MTSTQEWLRGAPRAVLTSPGQVCDALGIPFSDEQLEAICAPLEPGVIIAGAGSGKTTVMAARVVWLVGTGAVRPEQVLGLTFTRKAAGELAARVRASLEQAGVLSAQGTDVAGEQVVLTYDAFAGRVVAEHGMRLGLDGDPLMITGAARYRLASRVVTRASGPYVGINRLKPASVTKNLLRLDEAISAHLVADDALRVQAERFESQLAEAPLFRTKPYKSVVLAQAASVERRELLSLVQDYRMLKQRLGAVEFADQMASAARLVQEIPAVAQAYREQFAVVLLDEYQDTSSAQAQLLRGLFSGPDAEHGRGHAVTAVGDPFQGIYGWRGAAAGNIMAFGTEFPLADGSPAHRYSLTMNRRSGRVVLDVANAISDGLRHDPALEGAGSTVLQAPPDAVPGQVRVGTFATWPDEMDWIAEDILAARRRGTPWRENAVLSRSNSDIAAIYERLTEHDVPCEIVGLGGLLNLPEVADVVATLRVLQDPTASPDVVRLLTGPRWGLGKDDLVALGRRAGELAWGRGTEEPAEHDPLDALEEAVADLDPTEVACLVDAVADPGLGPYSETGRAVINDFAADLAFLRRHTDEPVLDLVRRIVDTLGLEVELNATPTQRRRHGSAQLNAFLEAVADYVDVDGDSSLSGMLAWLEAEADQGSGLDQAMPTDRDSVKLLTMHKSKGLEWPRVYLPDLADGTFPSTKGGDNWTSQGGAPILPPALRGDADSVPQLQEVSHEGIRKYSDALKQQARFAEDRLAYVAVTRAKVALMMTSHWWKPATVKARKRSPYLVTAWGHADEVVHDEPEPTDGATNPLNLVEPPLPWPTPLDAEACARREQSAREVDRVRQQLDAGATWTQVDAHPQDLAEADVVAGWDADLAFLLDEAAQAYDPVHDVTLPASMTTSQVMLAARAPELLAAELVRPMPRRPSRAASFGTRFHEWVERRFEQLTLPELGDSLFDPPDDGDITTEQDFVALCERFAAGQFGERVPAATEHPFTVILGEHVVRGRLDAVYSDGDGRWLVVDWKTSQQETADPLQLAVYRLAWAELHGIDVSAVDAAFYWVRTDRLEEHPDLPDRVGLERLIEALTQEK